MLFYVKVEAFFTLVKTFLCTVLALYALLGQNQELQVTGCWTGVMF